MSVKLRLLRKGRKRNAFYYIVAADARAPRDGRFIERVGSYNPNTNPATINLDLDASVKWLQNGAQPTDTVRGILSYKGAMHKDHLLRGAAKGAFPAEEVEVRFEKWMSEKENRIQSKRDGLAAASASLAQERLERESKVRLAREKAIIEKNTPFNERVEEVAESTEEVVAEAAVEEVVETPAAEEVVETPAAEVTEEAPAAEEAPATEATEEEKPAE